MLRFVCSVLDYNLRYAAIQNNLEIPPTRITTAVSKGSTTRERITVKEQAK